MIEDGKPGLEFCVTEVYCPSMRNLRTHWCLPFLAVMLLCCGTSIYAKSTNIRFKQLPRTVIRHDLDSFAYSNIAREAELSQLFHQAGCTPAEISREWVRRHDPPNIICTLPGKSSSTIIVSAHTDHVDLGIGVVDDWSGAALLPALIQSLADTPRRHTFVFVGFTDEEKGLVGSKYYVWHLSRAQVSHISAEVNLECLGLTRTKVWAARANKQLLSDLINVARSLKLNLQGVDVGDVGDDDTHSFLWRNIPVITIHSVTQKTWPILHSTRDNLSAVNFNDYYNSYQLIAAYLAYLDVALK